MEFYLSPPFLLCESNFLQAESRQIRCFPEFQVLLLSVHAMQVHDGISERSTPHGIKCGLLALFWDKGSPCSLRLTADFWGKVPLVPALLLFFTFSLSHMFPEIHSSWRPLETLFWRPALREMESACCPWNVGMSRASVPPVERPEVGPNATAKRGLDFLLQPLKLSAVIFQCGIIRTLARNLRCFVTLFLCGTESV